MNATSFTPVILVAADRLRGTYQAALSQQGKVVRLTGRHMTVLAGSAGVRIAIGAVLATHHRSCETTVSQKTA